MQGRLINSPSGEPPKNSQTFNSTLVLTAPLAQPQAESRSGVELQSADPVYRVAVVEAPAPRLTKNQDIAPQFVESGKLVRFAMPYDAFVHSQPEATVVLSAKLSDGRDLPPWIQFDAQSGSFQVNPPPGLVEELEIKVTARDTSNNLEATTIFQFSVGRGKTDGKPVSSLRLPGRSSLTEKIRLAANRQASWRSAAHVTPMLPTTHAKG